MGRLRADSGDRPGIGLGTTSGANLALHRHTLMCFEYLGRVATHRRARRLGDPLTQHNPRALRRSPGPRVPAPGSAAHAAPHLPAGRASAGLLPAPHRGRSAGGSSAAPPGQGPGSGSPGPEPGHTMPANVGEKGGRRGGGSHQIPPGVPVTPTTGQPWRRTSRQGAPRGNPRRPRQALAPNPGSREERRRDKRQAPTRLRTPGSHSRPRPLPDSPRGGPQRARSAPGPALPGPKSSHRSAPPGRVS